MTRKLFNKIAIISAAGNALVLSSDGDCGHPFSDIDVILRRVSRRVQKRRSAQGHINLKKINLKENAVHLALATDRRGNDVAKISPRDASGGARNE